MESRVAPFRYRHHIGSSSVCLQMFETQDLNELTGIKTRNTPDILQIYSLHVTHFIPAQFKTPKSSAFLTAAAFVLRYLPHTASRHIRPLLGTWAFRLLI